MIKTLLRFPIVKVQKNTNLEYKEEAGVDRKETTCGRTRLPTEPLPVKGKTDGYDSLESVTPQKFLTSI
jgi:hypothetical protein